MHPSSLSICLLVLLGACYWGTPPTKFPPAQGPRGAQVAVRVTGEPSDRVGELFAADSIGVVVRATRLIRVPWNRLHAMDVDRVGRGYDIPHGQSPDAAHVARLAALSRFPHGLRDDLLRRVLQLLAQDSVDIAAGLTLDSLAQVAERSSARFRDRRVAMVEGYRRVGADFPGMGEHWVNPAALLSDVVDPERPSFLTYVTLGREPRLLGVGFITTTAHGRAPNVPGWVEHWHEHSGLLAEESGAGRDEGARRAQAGSGTRVWVLHVWTWLSNPDGRFAADNWSLPFARAGIVPPASADPDAARAFALAGDERGDEFLRALLTDAGLRTPSTAAATDSIISATRDRSLAIAARLRAAGRTDDESLTRLRGAWRAMAASLVELLGDRTVTLLTPPHALPGHVHASH